MLDLARALLRLSTAVSIYGAERAGGMLAPSGPRRRRRPTGESLDALTWSTQEQLSENFRLVFQLSDDLQNEWLGPRGSTPASSEGALDRVVTVLGRALSTTGSVGAAALDPVQWRELANKIEVYRMVRDAHRLAAPAADGSLDLREAVECAYRSDSHEALWRIEGLAHASTRLTLEHTGEPSELLGAGELPPPSQLMVHAGMGLALADHVLSTVTPKSPASQVRRALGRFVDLCRANSDAQFVEAALESLGLISRCFYPGLMAQLADEVPRVNEVLADYFWHGVGRALYFLPIHLIPGLGTIEHALEMSDREAPDERSRESSGAGLAWAFTVVNLRHPTVMERFLSRHGESAPGPAFWQAVVQSIDSRHQTTPGAGFIGRFIRYRPADPEVARLWHGLIETPCERKIGSRYPREGDGREPPNLSLRAAREHFALAARDGGLT